MGLEMLGGGPGGMSVLQSNMGDCVSSPHSIHQSMSMYQVPNHPSFTSKNEEEKMWNLIIAFDLVTVVLRIFFIFSLKNLILNI